MNTRIADYYVFASRRGEHPGRWSWEIRRKSKPLGVRLTANGFLTEAAALSAGKQELDALLSDMFKEEISARK
jgi:hypothetical protein